MHAFKEAQVTHPVREQVWQEPLVELRNRLGTELQTEQVVNEEHVMQDGNEQTSQSLDVGFKKRFGVDEQTEHSVSERQVTHPVNEQTWQRLFELRKTLVPVQIEHWFIEAH